MEAIGLASAVKSLGRRAAATTLVGDGAELGSKAVVSRLSNGGYENLAKKLDDLRPSSVTANTEVDFAFLEYELRPELLHDLMNPPTGLGATKPQADAVLDAYFDDMASLLDDPSRIDEAIIQFNLNADAAEAYGRWGGEVFDANGGLVDDLVAAGGACRVTNSFGAHTLVLMADDSRLAIADVSVGDVVAAWDLDTGERVAREVLATLPHTDTLYEAYFSDGSVMSVTEDHRFWSATDSAWVELQNLDTDDVLLTPDGVLVTVGRLDRTAGADTAAWDLTIGAEHNFFVAADNKAIPVLVHNATAGFFCGEAIEARHAARYFSIDAALSDVDREALALVFDVAEGSRLLRILTAVPLQEASGIAKNAALDVGITTRALSQSDDVALAVLGNSQYPMNLAEARDWLSETVRYRSYLTKRADGSFISPGGLVYGSDANPLFDTRVDHVLNHTRPISRAVDHGVITSDDPLRAIDEALTNRPTALSDQPQPNGNTEIIISSPDVGYTVPKNGDPSAWYPSQDCLAVYVKTAQQDQIVTAFPVKCPA